MSLLTIAPGVKVLVAGAYEIDVLSTITAIGTATNPILFSALDPAIPWKGIKFTNTPSGSNFTYCIIEHANDSGLTLVNSVPVISHCTIRNNTAPLTGGGISAQLVSGQVLVIDGTTITNNTVNPSIASGNYSGGGLYIVGDSRLKNSTITNNVVNAQCGTSDCNTFARGAGIYSSGNLSMINSVISGNLVSAHSQGPNPLNGNAFAYGSGLYSNAGSASVRNSVLSCNTTTALCTGSYCGVAYGAFPRGSGAYINAGAAQIENVTIARNNKEGLWQGGGTASLLNSIVYFNNENGTQIAGGGVTATYSDVQGGFSGSGNINFNPAFVGLGCAKDDLAIVPGSPAIDSGNPGLAFHDECFPPSQGSATNDMGAFGGPGACNWLPRVVNISTRGPVETGDNLMIGGLIVDGSTPKTVLLRGRGPSLGSAPFFVPGTLANPKLLLFSGATLIGQNDNWQDAPACSNGFACGPPAQITATGLDPCQPNPGQPTSPPNCVLESAILITLPPGAYTAQLLDASGGVGIALVEAFEVDGSGAAKLHNISTRGLVGTGDDVMIGGFSVEGSSPKTVLVRGRGPSLSSAPFFVPGTLADPFLRVFSGAAMIAQNDHWQDGPSCIQGIACGTPVQITATGLDPCVPNPGQGAPPANCDLESAILITLDPGPYTVQLSGAAGQTGVGLVEIFEIPF